MNPWTQQSIELANQRDYLDQLFRVYPLDPGRLRQINEAKWQAVESAFNQDRNADLIRSLLDLKLFPVKDSYVAYLRKDLSAIERNPNTVDRLAGLLFEMGLSTIFERCSQPKETNRQIGPLFRRWLSRRSLGVPLLSAEEFATSRANAVLDGNDAQLKQFAYAELGYTASKGLDLVARFNGRYVIGEAKFLTDFGGHQNAQFHDAKAILNEPGARAIRVAILDGVLYIPGNHLMRRYLQEDHGHNVMSALLLREFLYQV